VEAPDDPVACYRALLESVDYWAMPNINSKTFGGKPKPVPASGRDRVEGILHLRGVSCTVATPDGHRYCVWDQPVGNSVGAIG